MQPNFDNLEMILFDSTIAYFKLTVKGTFTRERQDNSIASNIYMNSYTNRQGRTINTLKMNPNIYLILEYRAATYDESKQIWTSFPQLYPIRNAMSVLAEGLRNNAGFTDVEGILQVSPDWQEAIVVDGIGKDNKWISFSLAAVDEDDGNGNIIKKVPGVAIQISESDYASVLTAEEFLTVYTIINDLDLAGMQTQLSTMFYLSSELANGATAPMAAPSGYQQPQAPRQPYQQPVRQSQYNQNSNAAPAANSGARGGYGNSYQQPQRQATKPQYNQNQSRSFQPRTPQQPTRQQPENTGTPQQSYSQGNLPPRQNEKNIVNMKNVEETPVANFNFNDPDAVNSIFDDQE